MLMKLLAVHQQNPLTHFGILESWSVHANVVIGIRPIALMTFNEAIYWILNYILSVQVTDWQ